MVYFIFQYEGLTYQFILLSFGCFFFVICLRNMEGKDILSSKSPCLSLQQEMCELETAEDRYHGSLLQTAEFTSAKSPHGLWSLQTGCWWGCWWQDPVASWHQPGSQGWWREGWAGAPMVSKRYSQPRDSHPLQEGADSQGVPQAYWPQLNNK